jgi:hypothetical protein
MDIVVGNGETPRAEAVESDVNQGNAEPASPLGKRTVVLVVRRSTFNVNRHCHGRCGEADRNASSGQFDKRKLI